MKAHKFIDVYKEKPKGDKPGKTNLSHAQGKSGVYLIKENGKIVYVGQSQTNLYRTAIRHFQEWNDKKSPDRVTYKNGLKRNRYTIRTVFTSPTRASKLEEALIRKHKPRDNFDKLQFLEESPKQKEKEKGIINEYQQTYKDDVPF